MLSNETERLDERSYANDNHQNSTITLCVVGQVSKSLAMWLMLGGLERMPLRFLKTWHYPLGYRTWEIERGARRVVFCPFCVDF